MSLLETLRARQRVVTPDFRNTFALESAASSLKEAFPGYDQSRTLTVEEILRRLASSIASWEWGDIRVGDVAAAIRAVFSDAVVADHAVTEFLEREVATTANPALLAPAPDAYIEAWEASSPRTVWLATIMQQRLSLLPIRWQACFRAHPEILDSAAAPTLMAARMAEQRDPYEWLLDLGVAAPHSGKLMRALHFAWLEALPEPKTQDRIEPILAWMFPANGPQLEGDLAASALERLLRPWAVANAPGDLRTYLLVRVVEAFGDPRNQRPEFWSLVSAPCKRVVIRWLAGASMDALLAIITKSTSNHMWPPRHSFWKGLYDRGLIDEAWVALSPRAYSDAMTMVAETGEEIYRMVSRQTARSRKDTCLLIVRIGRYTVLEGSHDFRVHVFQATDPHAPALYEDDYDAESLILPQHHPDARMHDPGGNWMRWVEQRVLR